METSPNLGLLAGLWQRKPGMIAPKYLARIHNHFRRHDPSELPGFYLQVMSRLPINKHEAEHLHRILIIMPEKYKMAPRYPVLRACMISEMAEETQTLH